MSADFNPELPQVYQGVRLSGTYELPWNMLVASTFTAQQGEYFPRIVQVPNALEYARRCRGRGTGGPLRLGAADGPASVEDVRRGRHSFEGMFDVFNLTNTSVVLRHINVNGAELSEAARHRRHRRGVGEPDSRASDFQAERAI